MKRIRVDRPLLISGASILVAAIVVLVQLPALTDAIFSHGVESDPVKATLAGYIQGHKADHQKYVERVNGRSLFSKPPAPSRPVQDRPKVAEKVEQKAPVEAGPPPSYGGPPVMFVLGNEVWFRNGLTLSVGEEGQGVKVIAADPPWKVTLGHGGGTYDIELFKKIDLFKDNKPRAQRDFPGLKPAPSSPPAPAGPSEASP